jgi:hypothetical protein
VILQFRIDLIDELIDRYSAEKIPVPEQVVVIQDIQRYTGKTPTPGRESSLAGQYVRMLVRIGIDRSVVPEALVDRFRKGHRVKTPGKIPQ